MLCLTVRYGDQVLRFPLPKSDATIGSAEQNDIVLPFPGVSRRHARAVREGAELLLTDAGSKNRLILGGERLDSVKLSAGQQVQIGRAFLSIEEGSTSDILLGIEITTGKRAGSARGADTDTGDRSSADRAPALALRVIRELEFATEHALGTRITTYLKRVREVISASSVFILHDTHTAEPGLVAFHGDLPAEETLAVTSIALARAQRQRGPVVTERNGVALVAMRGGSSRRHEALVASFTDPASLRPWINDFLEYAAHRLLRDTLPHRVEEAPLADEVLVPPPEMVVGGSPAIQKLMTNLRATVRSRLDVLLQGETGTGKELFARMIHASGPTAQGPFVAINCAAIPSELLEAELFGVVGRVATGVDPKPGHFLQAEGGSIFLDEIGELTDPLQAKLLRVLQEREILPLGALSPRKINVRVIAASNSELYERTRSGRFRADLYYRLRGLQFHIPPLRERREDIPALVLAFVSRACAVYSKHVAGVSRRALALLMAHQWPGNIRELQNEVERAVLLSHHGGTLQSEHFAPVKWVVDTEHPTAPEPDVAPPAPATAASQEPLDLQAQVDALERTAILDALRRTGGNRSKAAQILGITRNGLAMKMARLGLNGK